MNAKPVYIAMWSGPRNISTAMMRSWGNRPDAFVCDEPFYAHYLQRTKLPHPGAQEVIAHHEPDWRKVVQWLTGPIPQGKGIFYQKHMAHHLLEEMDIEWLGRVTNGLLIRDPREMITSLMKFIPRPLATDTGLPQQVRILRLLRERGLPDPPILDATDILNDPRRMLGELCERVGVPFDERMLSWPPGRRDTDGIWAKHWYAQVEQTTGFQPFKPKDEPIPAELSSVYDECAILYDQLYAMRMK